jgi:hypothetical protein
VVLIGTNNSNGEDNTPGQIADGVRAIVNQLRARLPDMKVILLPIFPRDESYSPQRGKLAMINQVLRRLADDQNVFWIDFGHQFLNDDGTIPHNLMPDYLHPSRKGYAIWAEAIEPRLSSILGDAAIPPPGGAAGGGLTGEWIWTIKGPDGNPMDAALILKVEGDLVTGKFARGSDRWLEIENGKIEGNRFSWVVKRDRPDGSIMTYRMSGELVGDHITGIAKTEMDGSEAVSEWSAKRK